MIKNKTYQNENRNNDLNLQFINIFQTRIKYGTYKKLNKNY